MSTGSGGLVSSAYDGEGRRPEAGELGPPPPAGSSSASSFSATPFAAQSASVPSSASGSGSGSQHMHSYTTAEEQAAAALSRSLPSSGGLPAKKERQVLRRSVSFNLTHPSPSDG